VEELKTRVLFSLSFFESRAVYLIVLRNIVLFVRPQKTIYHRRIACIVWTSKATSTHSEYIIYIAFPQQQWLQARAFVLRYTYFGCLGRMWNKLLFLLRIFW